MEYATALRELADRPIWPIVEFSSMAWAFKCARRQERLVHRVVARLDNLVERTYLVGRDEGYGEGRQDGIREGKDEANCHRIKDEEWEHAL